MKVNVEKGGSHCLLAFVVGASLVAGRAGSSVAQAAVPIPQIAWNAADASIPATDDDYLEYTLPFTFPFFGRDIVKISVNTNGLIELLEAGESCSECEDYTTHDDGDHVSSNIDAIFAANDDLRTGVMIDGSSSRVDIIWIGTTLRDNSFDTFELTYKVVLFSDGRVRWEFYDMDYLDYYGDLFSGVYDEVGNNEYEIPGGSTSFSGESVYRSYAFDPTGPSIGAFIWVEGPGSIAAHDDDDRECYLPFVFPFFGRDIVKIHVNTNGLVELLEAGESCSECDDYNTHAEGDHVTKNIDAIFAANDNLVTGVMIDHLPSRVEIVWIGRTFPDDYFFDDPLTYKVVLFEDGRVRWQFFDMDYDSYDGDLFSGVYDEVGDVEYEVATGSISAALQGESVYRAFEFADADQDGVLDDADNCPDDANTNQADGDADGVGDVCDDCPDTAAGDSVDADGCSTDDDDGDGVLNDADDCPDTPNCARVDADGCPSDADGDGVVDGCDDCADTPTCATDIDANGCAIDSDGDGNVDGCEPPAQEGGCCGATGPVAPLGLAIGLLLVSRSVRRRRSGWMV